MDNSSSESIDHCVKECTNNSSISPEPPATIDVVNEQQLVETEQPDHLLPNDNKLLQHDKNTTNHSTVSDDHNDLTRSATVAETAVVLPSTVDASMPLILKYSRESEEKPADVPLCTVSHFDHHDDMTTDESLLMTCEFCGAEINPDFTPVHNEDNSNSSDSEEVNDILNVFIIHMNCRMIVKSIVVKTTSCSLN